MTGDNILGRIRKGVQRTLATKGPTVMMGLGPLRFGISSQEYDELRTSMKWRWAEKNRYLRETALQYQGKDATTKTLNVVIVAEYAADLDFLPLVQDVADLGQPLELVAGHTRPIGGASVVAAGANMGKWVITSLDINESNFLRDGTAILYEATLTIMKYGEDRKA
ncbi:MAG: phage tail protein [Aeromonas hydrophila]